MNFLLVKSTEGCQIREVRTHWDCCMCDADTQVGRWTSETLSATLLWCWPYDATTSPKQPSCWMTDMRRRPYAMTNTIEQPWNGPNNQRLPPTDNNALHGTRQTLAGAGISCCHASVRPSARPSVTSRCSTETAKRRIMQTIPRDNPGSLVFCCRTSRQNSNGVTTPQRRRQMQVE